MTLLVSSIHQETKTLMDNNICLNIYSNIIDTRTSENYTKITKHIWIKIFTYITINDL